jgi:hypothetical protein
MGELSDLVQDGRFSGNTASCPDGLWSRASAFNSFTDQ